MCGGLTAIVLQLPCVLKFPFLPSHWWKVLPFLFLSLPGMHCTCTMTLSISLRDDRRRWATRTRYTNDEDLHLRPKHHRSIMVWSHWILCLASDGKLPQDGYVSTQISFFSASMLSPDKRYPELLPSVEPSSDLGPIRWESPTDRCYWRTTDTKKKGND